MFIVHFTTDNTTGTQIAPVTRDIASTADAARHYVRATNAHLDGVRVVLVVDAPELSNGSAGLLLLSADAWMHKFDTTQGETEWTLISAIGTVAADRDRDPGQALGAYALMFSRQFAMSEPTTRELCTAILEGASSFELAPTARGLLMGAAVARQRAEFAALEEDDEEAPTLAEELASIAQWAGASEAAQDGAAHLLNVFSQCMPGTDDALADWIVKHEGEPPSIGADGLPIWNPTARSVLEQVARYYLDGSRSTALAQLIAPCCEACAAPGIIEHEAGELLEKFAAVVPEGATDATIARTIVAAHTAEA